MKTLIMLYKKEMKSIRDISIAIGVVIFLAVLAARISFSSQDYKFPPDINLLTIISLSLVLRGPYIFAVLLVYSFFIERKTKTDYMRFSLPIHRVFVIASKFSAVLSYAILISFGQALIRTIIDYIRHIIFFKHHESHYLWFTPFLNSIDHLWRNFISELWVSDVQYFTILSMTAAAIGVMNMVKRQRILVAVGVFILLHGVMEVTLPFTPGYSNGIIISSAKLSQYWCAEGIIFSLIGFYLYQRYADV